MGDIFKYMECVSLPLPGAASQPYCAAQLAYKDALRKFLPGKLRKYLFKWYAFPLVLLMPFFIVFCCMCCCGGGNKEKTVEKPTNGKSANGKANGKAGDGEKENVKEEKDT